MGERRKGPLACEWCGTPESTRSGRKFCSPECYGKSRQRLFEQSCAECCASFRPSKAGQRYCSRECARQGQTILKERRACEWCGNEFEPRGDSHRYCSSKCKGLAARRERSTGRVCEACGATLVRIYKARRLESNKQFEARRTCSSECATTLRAQTRARPWHVGSRTLLARTCDTCDVLLPAGEFQAGGDGVHRRTCRSCTPPSQRQPENVERARRHYKTIQERTRSGAVKHGQQWTGPELEIATRPDLTARQAAAMLGRTMYAVKGARQKCATDPKWIKVLGA